MPDSSRFPRRHDLPLLAFFKMICADDVRDSMPLFRSGCGGPKPTSALQLKLREIGMRRAQELNELWHSVLPETHLGNLVGNLFNVAYVAEFGTVAYAVAIWTTPIAANRMTDGWNKLELRRLAISNDAPKNTASRVLSVMRRLIKAKWPQIVGFVSYQALELENTGNAVWPYVTSLSESW